MLSVVRVFGSVTPLRSVDQRGEHAAHVSRKHHDRYRSWELARCTCRKSPLDISGLRRYVHVHDHLIKNTGYNGTKDNNRTQIR